MNKNQRKRLLEVSEWYGTFPQEERMKWQDEFGQYGIPDRETKFLQWLNKNKYSKK